MEGAVLGGSQQNKMLCDGGVMNGPEFFMKYAGYRLLPKNKVAADVISDAQTLFGISLPQSQGSSLRLSSCWMVVTPEWVATNFKVLPETGFKTNLKFPEAIRLALKSGQPCMILSLGKRTLQPRDLFVTYDPRATRKCSEGSIKTYDATLEKDWTS
jgi:hypothetical protein